MTNPIQQYLQIQFRDGDEWFNIFEDRYEMKDIHKAFTELGNYRRITPDREHRLVSIAVTLLEGIAEGYG